MAVATTKNVDTTSNNNNSAKEAVFSPTDKIFYPQLIRLRDDFNLMIMHDIDNTSSQEYFFLFDPKVSNNEDSSTKKARLTPFFDSLTELEDHVEDNILDLLHRYLCR